MESAGEQSDHCVYFMVYLMIYLMIVNLLCPISIMEQIFIGYNNNYLL